jgi:ribosomal protein L33
MGWRPTPEQRAALVRAHELASQMRDGGITWKAVADRLTADGYPTMHGSPWTYQMVQRLVRKPPPADPTTTHATRHWRLAEYCGPAKLLKCVDCAAKGIDKYARDWSWRHGTDPEEVMNYDPRCRKCHNAYDPTMGHHTPHTEEARARMSASLRQHYGTDEREALARLNPDQPLPRAGANEHNSGKTTCPANHEYDEANTYIDKNGFRSCKKCMRERTRQWRADRKAKLAADRLANPELAVKAKANSAGKGSARTGQALENIRRGSQKRRERERAEREAGEAQEGAA